MSIPKKIKVEGKIYISESVAPNKNGEKLLYKGEKYIAESEDLPPELVMFEGVAYKRGPSVADYMKKIITESVGASKPMPKKIRLKGTNLVFEAVGGIPYKSPDNIPYDSRVNSYDTGDIVKLVQDMGHFGLFAGLTGRVVNASHKDSEVEVQWNITNTGEYTYPPVARQHMVSKVPASYIEMIDSNRMKKGETIK